MTEYIDKQALLKKYCKEHHKGDCKRCDLYGDTWCMGKLYGVQIEEFPAADVAPVRHGRWISQEDTEDTYGDDDSLDAWYEWLCSACHNDICYEDPMERRFLPKYCPNCGAKMDGGEER